MKRRRAFTLVEVLAALVLIGVVLPVAMRAVTISLHAAGRGRHVLEATQLAQQKIAEVLILRDTDAITGSGDFDAPWTGYHWNMTSVGREDGTYEITVTVSWTEQNQTRDLALSTLMYPRETESSDSTEDDS